MAQVLAYTSSIPRQIEASSDSYARPTPYFRRTLSEKSGPLQEALMEEDDASSVAASYEGEERRSSALSMLAWLTDAARSCYMSFYIARRPICRWSAHTDPGRNSYQCRGGCSGRSYWWRLDPKRSEALPG